jgi:ABC-2 type transport system ATP-binding protein/lipopolysaccharide transport system ATP-binding protein
MAGSWQGGPAGPGASPAGSSIVVDDVSKTFRLYTERRSSLKERVVKRGGARFEEFYALRDVSFEVEQGTTFGLIGHNGSGKSTLLKLMAGIHRPSAGSISHSGRVSALLELGAGFHPELSGRDNIYLNGSILGIGKKQIDQAVERIIDFSGLEEFVDTPVKVYSSGMYVRLGFSIAVNLDPEILIMDEIIAVGDEEFQRRCFDHLYKLRQKGVTIVFVSHSLGLVQSLCDRVAWLDHGRLRMEGPAAEVTQAYLREVNAHEAAATTAAADPADDGAAGSAAGRDAESRRPGTHEIVIEGVDLLDQQGRAVDRLVAGRPLRAVVRYDARQPVRDPVFGIGVYTENDVYVTGDHMRIHDRRMGEVHGPGSVEYRLDPLPLNPGGYRLSFAVTDWSLAHQYDLWDRAVELQVRESGEREHHGLVTLPGAWSAARTRSTAELEVGT